MRRLADVDEVLDLFGVSDRDIYARATIEDAVLSGDVETYTKAEPPKMGKAWIYIDDDNWIYDSYKCPWCGKEITVDAETSRSDIGFTIEDMKYCPNCGAKMEK